MNNGVPHIVIIGGGITGLTTAYRLRRRAQAQGQTCRIELIDAQDRLGGVIRTVQRDGVLIEEGPDSFVTDKKQTLELAKELGIESEVISTRAGMRRSFIVHNQKLHAIPEGFAVLGPSKLGPLIRTPILSWRGKARAGLEWFLPPKRDDQDESVGAFVRRRFGNEVLERLAEPMIRGIASDSPDKLSIQALLPHFKAMEQQHGSVMRGLMARRRAQTKLQSGVSGARYGLFATFQQGMQVLVDTLVASNSIDEVRLSTRVDRIQRRENGWGVVLEGGEAILADAVCIALPPNQAARLVRSFDNALASALAELKAASWITVNYVFKREAVGHALDGFGFVAPSKEKLPITGCTFSHVKYEGRAPEDKVLLRAYLHYDSSTAMRAVSNERAEQIPLRTLEKLLSIKGRPEQVHIQRFPDALTQYGVGHAQRVEAIRQKSQNHLGLAIAGNGFYGQGIPGCIQSADEAVEKLLEGMKAYNQSANTP